MKDYPQMTSYKDYINRAKDIFASPEKIYFDESAGEFYYVQGEDLLRMGTSGNFVSLYPGVDSARVIKSMRIQ